MFDGNEDFGVDAVDEDDAFGVVDEVVGVGVLPAALWEGGADGFGADTITLAPVGFDMGA